MNSNLKPKAFTIVEIMVVIVIVIILVSMLAPALSARRQRLNVQPIEKVYDSQPLFKSDASTYVVSVYRFEYEGKTYLINSKGGIILHETNKLSAEKQ